MKKTIVQKLNLQKYKKIAILSAPENTDYFKELSAYDTELANDSYDLIFAFVLDMKSLQTLVNTIIEKNYLQKDGYAFFAYPKKGNKQYPTFIHRDDLLDGLGADEDGFAGKSNLKFSRMVGLDDVFTVVGLKEASKEKNRSSTKVSQCVDDYIAMIPQIEKDLQDTPRLLDFYQSLTSGYQKEWARYVYSAKQEATKEKRREEMKLVLSAGYKSRDLYQRDNR